jgi:thiol-disulfide isomerase/thioredoxin
VLTAAVGKPSVVIFWLTTCGPCRTELNTIKANFAAWQREQPFQIVAISEEYPHRFGVFRERVMQEQWPWQAYNDVNHEFANILNGGLNGLPQVFIFDAKGALRYQTRKFTPGDELTLFEQIKLAAQ